MCHVHAAGWRLLQPLPAYPSRTITLINLYAAGGPADTLAERLELSAAETTAFVRRDKDAMFKLPGNLNLPDK